MKENAKITLTISRGVEIVTMPDLSGMSRAEALNACKEKGLMPTFKTETVPKGAGERRRPAHGPGLRYAGGGEHGKQQRHGLHQPGRGGQEHYGAEPVGVASLSEAQDLIRVRSLCWAVILRNTATPYRREPSSPQNPVSGTPAKMERPCIDRCVQGRAGAHALCAHRCG